MLEQDFEILALSIWVKNVHSVYALSAFILYFHCD